MKRAKERSHRRKPDYFSGLLRISPLIGLGLELFEIHHHHLHPHVLTETAIGAGVAAGSILLTITAKAISDNLPNRGKFTGMAVGLAVGLLTVTQVYTWMSFLAVIELIVFPTMFVLDYDYGQRRAARDHPKQLPPGVEPL